VADSKLCVIVTSLETLVPLWPKVQKDRSCATRLAAVCNAVEFRVLQLVDMALANPHTATKVQGLRRFAQTYDTSKGKLIKSDGAALVGRINAKWDEAVEEASSQAEVQAIAIEVELSKGANCNLHEVSVSIASLLSLKPLWMEGPRCDKLRQHLEGSQSVIESFR